MSLLLLSGFAAGASPFDARIFARRAFDDRVAKLERVERCRIDLDDDGRKDRLAVRLGLAVVELGDRLALLTGNHFECGDELVHETVADPVRTLEVLDLQDGAFVVTSSSRHDLALCDERHTRIDWTSRTVHLDWIRCDEPRVPSEGAVIVVGGAGAEEPVPLAFSAYARGEPAQRAEGRVVASWNDGNPRLEVIVEDDLEVALPANPSPQDWITADHVQLWCEDDGGGIHLLGVARSAEGPLVAAWLQGGDSGPREQPRASSDAAEARPHFGEGYSFRVPERCAPRGGWLANPVGHARVGIAFSDSDGPEGQHTLIATSGLRWRDPASFGVLAWWSGDSWLPPWDGGLEWVSE